MSFDSTVDFDNIDYTQIGGTIGVIGGIVWGMRKSLNINNTILCVFLLGISGAFIGSNIDKLLKYEKDEG